MLNKIIDQLMTQKRKSARATPDEIWSVIEGLHAGKTPDEIAKSLGRPKTTIVNWQKKYQHLPSLAALKRELHPEDTRYVQIMRRLFEEKWHKGSSGFEWHRNDLPRIARDLGIEPPKNLGDNIYSIRHGREDLPEEIRALAPPGKEWLLLPNGRSVYKFVLAERAFLNPDESKQPIKIPDSTPQLVARYATKDEQAVLARIRYCRLVDIFMGLASFQLQSHKRTTVSHFNGAQTELDDIYVGVDMNGTQFVIPIQAKGDSERMGVVQIITDHYACAEHFPNMVTRTLTAKTVRVEEHKGLGEIFTIALIEAIVTPDYSVRKIREEHFQLVPASLITNADLESYQQRFRPLNVSTRF